VRIGAGEVAFNDAMFSFIFDCKRKMRGLRSGAGFGADDDGERVRAHGFEKYGPVSHLVELG
jgi:hypothetical protein